MIEAFPLCWPDGEQRTPPRRRKRAPFQQTFGAARDHLLIQLRRMKAKEVIVSTDMPLRRDGYPYAGKQEPQDPGVAVYWSIDGQAMSMACDCWDRLRDNVRAIGKSLEALRGIERWGGSAIMDRAFRGFTALPPAGIDWRTVLKFGTADRVSRKMVVDRFRDIAMKVHPDQGGSRHDFERLAQARDAALAELSQ